ncbi:MAG TPA: hypothetical protein VL361_00030 [Candidatus Limnocylindrales bacterium]|jgi:hypothetical protein|nr:hypothetical protein [Candidatus Limnocylindrales bacterium]
MTCDESIANLDVQSLDSLGKGWTQAVTTGHRFVHGHGFHNSLCSDFLKPATRIIVLRPSGGGAQRRELGEVITGKASASSAGAGGIATSKGSGAEYQSQLALGKGKSMCPRNACSQGSWFFN